MAIKNIKSYYYWPTRKTSIGIKIVSLKNILQGLKNTAMDKRILFDGEDNIQLKYIENKNNRWYLSFLKNTNDTPFICKLNEDISSAEELEDDEFVGQECCCIYDEKTNIIALQNNTRSISYNKLSEFFNEFSTFTINIQPITFKDKYCNISEDDAINYKSVIVGFTDISLLANLAKSNNSKDLENISKLATSLSALNGKIELNVGRNKRLFLDKITLKDFVSLFKNKQYTKTLKVKMVDNDTIRLIDLINNKVYDEFSITIKKDDPKTFKKILDPMDISLSTSLNGVLSSTEKIIDIN